MLETLDTYEPITSDIDDSAVLSSPEIEELTQPHIGKWNKLVSQTNWEKGNLILRWRNEMIAADFPRAAYSDDAWARRVGNVTPQHVGRLRRVAERFCNKSKEYPNLFWSHFQTALDWEDAELWLEGAVQNDWSVAQMRVQRWEAVGAPEELKPREEDIFTTEIDEDAASFDRQRTSDRTEPRTSTIGAADIVEGFDPSAIPPFDVEDSPKRENETKKSKPKSGETVADAPLTGEVLATLKNTAELPADLAESFETLQVAILNHKLAGWKDVTPQKITKRLDTLKSLVCSVEG
jgi:hypothetical protein